MNYAISLTIEAEHDLARLPSAVRRFCGVQLRLLGDAPTVLSKPSRFPYREKCQMFQFGCLHANDRWELNALFQYSQDETTLVIIGIRFSKLPRGAESGEGFPQI
ncbi:MAG: hypothetical protein ABSH22_00110 [Tepidisphaeraceae bacterium]